MSDRALAASARSSSGVRAVPEPGESVEVQSVRAACHELAVRAGRALAEVSGCAPLTPDGSWLGQMAAAELPVQPEQASAIKTRLYDVHRIEIPIVVWQGRVFIRVSFQGYNTAAELEILCAALAETLGSVA